MLWRVAQDQAPSDHTGSIAKFPSIMDVVDRPDLMNTFLWRHAQGSSVESNDSRCLALISDTGHCGMKLDCWLLVHQSGRVSSATPQAQFVQEPFAPNLGPNDSKVLVANRRVGRIELAWGGGGALAGWHRQDRAVGGGRLGEARRAGRVKRVGQAESSGGSFIVVPVWSI